MTSECNFGQFDFFDVKNKFRRLSARERAIPEGDSTCYARNIHQSSTRLRQTKKGFPLLVLKNKVDARKKKAESRITDDTKMRVRCTRNIMNPMVNTTLTPMLR